MVVRGSERGLLAALAVCALAVASSAQYTKGKNFIYLCQRWPGFAVQLLSLFYGLLFHSGNI